MNLQSVSALHVLVGSVLWLLSAASSSASVATSGTDLRTCLAWQLALEQVGFSAGLIDGRIGPKLTRATREFQRVRGLPVTGQLDPATRSALHVEAAASLTTYTVQAADLKQVGPVPKKWIDKSKLERLPYESLSSALAERFHCSRGLLAQLNPQRDLTRLRPGDTLTVPHMTEPPIVRGERVEIDLAEKLIRVLDRDHRIVGLFHCSVAKDKAKLPSRPADVVVISREPTYVFDPEMWPEVKDVDRKLLIPPGPRNPVGVCWIGLSLPGYGIHGTPNPELIGKTGSHGCIRLTNWDALRLASMIRVGTPVRFIGAVDALAARAGAAH
ncbi:MAG TPA: L,D-transpeptidase [Phycisphaerae bacterium]